MKVKWILVLFFVVGGLGAVPRATLAANIWDPQPPMNWDEMLKCETVVVARYESHETGDAFRAELGKTAGLTRDKEQTLTLRIDQVLKGKNLKSGDLLRVNLHHWYTIETHPVDDFRSAYNALKADEVPRLCYKWQPSNPGGLTPRQIVPDVREEVLYFFPKADAPALERNLQVQSTELEAGWTKALNGQTLDVPFRLAQNLSSNIQRQALEELDASRDPAILDQMFEWLDRPQKSRSLPNVAEQTLMAIGDSKDDVYNRAFKRLSLMPKEWIPYAKMTPVQQEQLRLDQNTRPERFVFSTYAHIMAEVDGERAAHDFVRIIANGPPVLAETVGQWLGFTYSPFALDFAFQLLKSNETALMGAEILRNLLFPMNSSARSPRNRERQTAHLRALAKPRLASALQLKVFDASRTDKALDDNAPSSLRWMRLNREALETLLSEEQAPALVDLVHAQQVLLHPNEKTFDFGSFGRGGQFIQGEGIQLIKAIDSAADPRFIPLLVEMLRTVSPGIQNGEVQGTLRHYIVLYPTAFKREMSKQGLTSAFYNSSALKGQGFDARVLAILGNTSFVWTLEWPGESRFGAGTISDDVSWVRRYATSPALLRDMAQSIRSDLDKSIESAVVSLRFLLLADPAITRPLLDQALQMRGTLSRHERAPVLALGVANGHPELLDELLKLLTVTEQEKREQAKPKFDPYDLGFYNVNDADSRVLLWAQHPRATQLYLKVLDSRLGEVNDDASVVERRSESTPAAVLQALFAQHSNDFFERVSRLLDSSSLSQRRVAERVLQNTLYWNLDLEAQELTRDRTEKLRTIKPLLVQMGTLTEPQTRVLLLERLGIRLPEIQNERQSVLLRLASSPDPAISSNALRLLELMTGDASVEGLAGLSAPQQDVAFKALLRDHA